MLQDNSKYKAKHDEIVEFFKQQISIDLNEYRDGNGSDPFTTTYWDINGPALCVNWCGSVGGMSESIQNRITDLVNKTERLTCEWGGAWFKYIWMEDEHE